MEAKGSGAYTVEEKDQIVREYFGPAGATESPLCPRCGEVLKFKRSRSKEDFLLVVSCPECRSGFVWRQLKPEQSWKPLHLEYFIERHRMGDVLRCPVDDCYIAYIEYSDRILEFRCPYCNRRGQAQLPPRRGKRKNP
ncbi:MAG: hypothetical protein HY645_08545 [Acidobacteria bacterium]|nr:hypothetical protein [Acidobacteriota bacterium]